MLSQLIHALPCCLQQTAPFISMVAMVTVLTVLVRSLDASIFTIAVSKGAPWGRFQHQHLSQRAGSRYGFHLRLPPNAISCHQKYPHLRLHQQSSMRPQQVWIPELSVITSSSSLLTTSPPSGRRWSSWFGASGEHPQPWRSLRSCK